MKQARTLSTVLALGALTALPACSMMGGGSDHQYSQRATPAAAAPAATAQQAQENNPAVQPVSPQMIRQVQTALRHDHLYRGHVDGQWGPMTQHAVMTYQQRHNLNATGQIDGPTLQAMNLQNQYGEGNGGANGNMAGTGMNGSNGAMSNTGSDGSTGANGTYSTGNQNQPGMNAGNMPAPNNGGMNSQANTDGNASPMTGSVNSNGGTTGANGNNGTGGTGTGGASR